MPDQVMLWHLSDRADPRGKPLADRHYNRQHPHSPQYAPPGGCVVLLTAPHGDATATAIWITSTPIAAYVKHQWAGAWVNSLFRNEHPGLHLSSMLILQAVAATRHVVGDPPPPGIVSFVDPGKVRRKRDPGRCYRRAGFTLAGETKGGLLAFQLLPADMPSPAPPRPRHTDQLSLWDDTSC